MTIPYLMNCAHSSDSWCLDCVKVMGDENAELRANLSAVMNQRDELLDEIKDLSTERDELKEKLTRGPARIQEAERGRDMALDALAHARSIRGMGRLLSLVCPDPECMYCGMLLCPHNEPLHLHHDGCPACHIAEATERLKETP